MKKVYIIHNNSYKWNDVYRHSTIMLITTDYNKALEKFDHLKVYCKNTLDDPKWCYSYSLSWYYLDTYPVKEECLYEIDNVSKE